MVQNSGLFSRSVPSDSSDMGQHLKSIPQGSMLGHVAATRLEHLLGLAVLQFPILPTPRCKDLKRQKHLQPQRVSKRKKVNHYLVGYICWLLSTFSLSSCCTFPHMRWQLALSFLFGTIFRHFSEQLTLTVPTPRYTMAARLRVFLLACYLLKKDQQLSEVNIPLNVKENSKSPRTKGVQLMGAFNIFQHETLFGRNQHINPGFQQDVLKTNTSKSRIPGTKKQRNAGAHFVVVQVTSVKATITASALLWFMTLLVWSTWPSILDPLHGCKRRHPRNCKWTKVSKSSLQIFFWGAASLLQAPILDTSHLRILTAWTWCSSTWSWHSNNHNENLFFCHISTPKSAQVPGNESRASIPLLEWNSCSPFKYSSRHCDLSASQKSRQ